MRRLPRGGHPSLRDEVDKFTAYMEDPALAIAEIERTFESYQRRKMVLQHKRTEPFKALQRNNKDCALKKSGSIS